MNNKSLTFTFLDLSIPFLEIVEPEDDVEEGNELQADNFTELYTISLRLSLGFDSCETSLL